MSPVPRKRPNRGQIADDAKGHERKCSSEDNDNRISELSRAIQFEVRSSNLCAEGLSRIASANHATDCFVAASAASREEYTLPE
jgi:hypothetical protein